MVRIIISTVLTNLPALLLAVALLIAFLGRTDRLSERVLRWVLLLPIGFSGIWAALFHVFFASTAASDIGWQTSPFQYEVGMADLAIGVTAVLAFWRSIPFKAAATIAASIFLLGDAVGHVHQMIAAHNFASGNAGVPFYSDVFVPLIAIVALVAASRDEAV
jgi:hypothetical protein